MNFNLRGGIDPDDPAPRKGGGKDDPLAPVSMLRSWKNGSDMAVREMVDFLATKKQVPLDRHEAYSLVSMAGDCRVSPVVDVRKARTHMARTGHVGTCATAGIDFTEFPARPTSSSGRGARSVSQGCRDSRSNAPSRPMTSSLLVASGAAVRHDEKRGAGAKVLGTGVHRVVVIQGWNGFYVTC